MNILIIGFGFVGKATYLLNNKDINVYVYDINPDLCIPLSINLDDAIINSDLIFINLPTPLNIDGSCNTKIIDDILLKINHKYVINRSTVPIGYCDSKKIFSMPEFLTEKNWKDDFINNKHWIFGIYDSCSELDKNFFINKINKLFNLAHINGSIKNNDLVFCNNKEIELTKLIKNTFLSSKVSFFNEIYDLAKKIDINYNNVIDLIKYDERIGMTHMNCPGYDNKRGYGGTCFPKDTNSLYNQMIQNDVDAILIEANLYRNEIIDRPEKDWLINNNNRTFIHDAKYKIILVIGGDEIFGKKLCEELLNNNNNKIIYIHESSSLKKVLEKNIKQFFSELLTNENFKFLQFDLTKKIFIPHIDEIYHLALITSPIKYDNNYINVMTINFQGTKNILELAKIHNAKILFTSTSINNDDIVDESNKLAKKLIYEYKKNRPLLPRHQNERNHHCHRSRLFHY